MIESNSYVNRELSWLQFNARVLQEAADKSVPLIERLRFIGIFSNNLDEFFKVRYATVKRIVEAGKVAKTKLGGIKAEDLLHQITNIVIKHQANSLLILNEIHKELEQKNIFVINEKELTKTQKEFVKDHYNQKISPALVSIILQKNVELPVLKDKVAYLAVKMKMRLYNQVIYALIEIPKSLDRFIVLPKEDGNDYIIMIDDVIRYCLDDIFQLFDYTKISAHMIKITRDGELDFDTDLSKSFLAKISESVKDRRIGEPVRFVYDQNIDNDTINFLLKKMKISTRNSLIPGGRYHNRRDYMGFPSLGRKDLLYSKIKPLEVKGLSLNKSIFESIKNEDFLINPPFHTFSYIVKFLREAALDLRVKSIKITVYRLANISHIASSLINAAKNGKKVDVCIELQARFDEEANIRYANIMQDAGINVMFGVHGLKVHSKICVVERQEIKGEKPFRYGFVSTGNFNESTAKIYTDFTILTANQKILKEVSRVFSFFEETYKIYSYKHLITSPQFTKPKFHKLIDNEIENAKTGKPAYIKMRFNSLSSYDMIDKLYEASRAGVKIQLIIRGICCLVPGIKGMSENIEVISIIDKFLEHTRLYMFCNDNNPQVYISSADLMTRNIINRVEVSCPVYSEKVKQELLDIFEISWQDNIKSRVINESQDNSYKRNNKDKVRSQFKLYDYFEDKLKS